VSRVHKVSGAFYEGHEKVQCDREVSRFMNQEDHQGSEKSLMKRKVHKVGFGMKGLYSATKNKTQKKHEKR